MGKKIYNKLIRDRIPEIIVKSGHTPKVSVLNKTKYALELKKKVLEEAKELLDAKSKDDVTNELSDIEELVIAIAKNYTISKSDIEKYRLKKLRDRGGFKKKLFLEYVNEK